MDYRELNKITVTEKYPIPRLEEILDKMSGAKIFSVIDLRAGYHQIPMEAKDCGKTAFQVARAKYEFQ
ncbi:reverse transcriptase domain-containing protein, partial [Klebsiella pneumoniae]|uniref:reverse transcriptase domain-containing protein n=1 Tax=Klebsiella pneumoniae TaxID=573 RepID=UPI0040557785